VRTPAWRAVLWTVPLLAATGVLLAANRVGEKAEDFTLTDRTGRSVSLSDYRGKVVLLQMTNLTCPVGHGAVSGSEALYQRYRERGLQVLHLLLDVRNRSQILFWERRWKITFPALWDRGNFVFDAYRTERYVPLNVIVDPEMIVRYNWAGYKESEMIPIIERYLPGKPAPKAAFAPETFRADVDASGFVTDGKRFSGGPRVHISPPKGMLKPDRKYPLRVLIDMARAPVAKAQPASFRGEGMSQLLILANAAAVDIQRFDARLPGKADVDAASDGLASINAAGIAGRSVTDIVATAVRTLADRVRKSATTADVTHEIDLQIPRDLSSCEKFTCARVAFTGISQFQKMTIELEATFKKPGIASLVFVPDLRAICRKPHGEKGRSGTKFVEYRQQLTYRVLVFRGRRLKQQ